MNTFFKNKFIFVMLLLAGCSSNRGEHLSITEAKRALDFPLVPSVTNVFYHQDVGGLQSLDRFIRFDVAVGDISNQINMIVTENNRALKRSLPYSRTNLQAAEIIEPFKKNVQLDWWNPGQIEKGYYVG